MKTPPEYREMEFVGLLIELAKLFKPQIYVELGVKKGYTITRLAPYVGKAIGIDIDPVQINLPNVTTHVSTTQDFAKTLCNRDPFIDFLFIDADHSYKAVLDDFDAYLPHVKSNGLIFLHDTHPIKQELTKPGYCHDAWKAASEINDCETGVEIVTLPGPWAGLSIIRKFGKHHLAWR